MHISSLPLKCMLMCFIFLRFRDFIRFNKDDVKSKVFYGQEPPSGESTTTESGVNYQLFSVMH